MERLCELRALLKGWETVFERENGRRPGKVRGGREGREKRGGEVGLRGPLWVFLPQKGLFWCFLGYFCPKKVSSGAEVPQRCIFFECSAA